MTRQDQGAANGTGVYPMDPRCVCGCLAVLHAIGYRSGQQIRTGCSTSGCECRRYAAGVAVMADVDPILVELRWLRMVSRRRAKDVARAAGVDPSSVSYWENGKVSPHLDKLRAYMTELGLDLAVVPLEES